MSTPCSRSAADLVPPAHPAAGPLGWLVPSEVQPMETRSAGFSLSVSCNMFFSFMLGQCFLTMLCSME